MNDGIDGSGGGEPPVVQSQTDFTAAVHWAVGAAAQRGARQMIWVDPDFASWPLGEPALLAPLTEWLLRPGRSLVLLAESFDALPRRHARFVAWRRSFSHALETRLQPEDEAGSLPTLLLDDGPVCLQLLDRVRWRGRCTLDVRQARLWREQIDALLQRSPPGFPVTQLGI